MRKLFVIPMLVALFLLACSGRDEKRVKLLVHLNAPEWYLIDSVGVNVDYRNEPGLRMEWDSVRKEHLYVFDSTRAGPLVITVASLLGHAIQIPVKVSGDTIISLDPHLYPDWQKWKRKQLLSVYSGLREGDSLVLGEFFSGCFNHRHSELRLRRTREGVAASFRSDLFQCYNLPKVQFTKELDARFLPKIDSFLYQFAALKSENSSTAYTQLTVRFGSRFFRSPDLGAGDWNGFYDLIRAIDSSWLLPPERFRMAHWSEVPVDNN